MDARKLHLKDISQQLGYSKTLISMVINGKGNQYGISKKTQAEVIDAVARLNYAPNKFAKSLRTGKSYLIGFVVGDVTNPFYSAIASSIERKLLRDGYNLLLCNTEEDAEREQQMVEMLINQQGVDALIVASTLEEPEFYNHPRFSHVPMLFVDRAIPRLRANHILVDNYGASFELVRSLIEWCGTKICCLVPTPLHLSSITERMDGYKMAMLKAEVIGYEQWMAKVRSDFTCSDLEEILHSFLNSGIVPDAFYTLNGTLALALLKTLQKEEYSAFKEVKIASFDDLDCFDLIERKIFSISQPLEEIGKTSADVITGMISGRYKAKSNIVFSPKLIKR